MDGPTTEVALARAGLAAELAERRAQEKAREDGEAAEREKLLRAKTLEWGKTDSQEEKGGAGDAKEDAKDPAQIELDAAAKEAEARASEDARVTQEARLDPSNLFPEVPVVTRLEQVKFKAASKEGEAGDEEPAAKAKAKGRPKAKAKGKAAKPKRGMKRPARREPEELEEVEDSDVVEVEEPEVVKSLEGEFEEASSPKGEDASRSNKRRKPVPKASPTPVITPKAKAHKCPKSQEKEAIGEGAEPKRRARKGKGKEAEAEEEVSRPAVRDGRVSFGGRYPPKTSQALSRFNVLVETFHAMISGKVDGLNNLEVGFLLKPFWSSNVVYSF